METIGIVGPGATGLVLAASFLRTGHPVRLLTRTAAQAAALRRRGLRVDGKHVRPGPERISHRGRDLRPCGILLLCVKSPDTGAALRACRDMAGAGARLLSIQNGLDHLAPARRAFGDKAVFGAAYFAADREESGARRNGGDGIELGLGTRNREAASALARLLRSAGWRVRLAAEQRVLWTKLLLNAAINPLGALTGRPNGDLRAEPALRELMLKALREARRLSPAGAGLPAARSLELTALRLCASSARNLNSMAQDLRLGRRTEVDSILGPLLSAAGDPARDAPILSGLRRFVKGMVGAARR